MEAGGDSDRRKNLPALPEIKVIIIGSKAEFKCNAANTILGYNDYITGKEIVESTIRQRENKSRSLTVAMTPGWWRSFQLAESAKYIQTEIMHSLTLCPDPHAFLLVINLHTPFTGQHLSSVVEHMEILGEHIWNHTIVLLMYNNKKEKTANVEKLVRRAGAELNNIIKKCGNRFHVFNYTVKRGKNVEKLFHEIDRLVAENGGECLKIDSELLENMEEKREMVRNRTEERKIEVKHRTQTLKEHLTEIFFPDLRIILMGVRLAGKITVMNAILGSEEAVSKTKTCVLRKREVEKRKVLLISTPGWWPYASKNETADSIKQEILKSVTLCSPGAHAVLLVLQSGVAFTEAHRRSIKEHMELLGVNVWSHCIVVFTRGDWMGTPTIEEHIESEGEALQWLINNCGNRYHVLNNMQNDGKQVRELIEKVEMMVRTNKELLTPAEEGTEETDSGCESENLERGSNEQVRPQYEYINKWMENADAARTFSRLTEDFSEDMLGDLENIEISDGSQAKIQETT